MFIYLFKFFKKYRYFFKLLILTRGATVSLEEDDEDIAWDNSEEDAIINHNISSNDTMNQSVEVTVPLNSPKIDDIKNDDMNISQTPLEHSTSSNTMDLETENVLLKKKVESLTTQISYLESNLIQKTTALDVATSRITELELLLQKISIENNQMNNVDTECVMILTPSLDPLSNESHSKFIPSPTKTEVPIAVHSSNTSLNKEKEMISVDLNANANHGTVDESSLAKNTETNKVCWSNNTFYYIILCNNYILI